MNPVFLKIGPIELHYYGLMYAIAFFVGISLGKKIAKERNFDLDLVENYAFVAIISGLLGGRIYYVLFNLPYYLQNPSEILAIWHGGMAIHGGILGGIVGTLIFAKIKKINPLILGDFAAGPFILGQAIGRIGNFMSGILIINHYLFQIRQIILSLFLGELYFLLHLQLEVNFLT